MKYKTRSANQNLLDISLINTAELYINIFQK